MKRGTPDNRKIGRLKRSFVKALGLPSGRARTLAVGTLELLWHETMAFAPDGAIGRGYSDEELAEKLGWEDDPESAAVLVEALVESGWLDRFKDGRRLWVHGWDEHCEHSVHMKLCRAVQLFANRVCPQWKQIPATEQAILIPRWMDRFGEIPSKCGHRVIDAKVERNGDKSKVVRTDGSSCEHESATACARPLVRTPWPLPRPLPGSLPEPKPLPGEEGHGVPTACAQENPSSSFSADVNGVVWDRESNVIRIDTSVVKDHPGDCVFREFFARWASDFVDFEEGVTDVDVWAVTCAYWNFRKWNPAPFDRILDRYRQCLNGQRAVMVDEMAEKGVVAPRVVLWDSTAPAGMGPGHVALSAADEALWGKVLGSLREEVGETAWGEYFTELWCFRDEKTGVLDIVAPSERSRSWLVSAYSAAIREAMVAHFGSAIGYTFSATEVTEEKGQKTS